jgi:hypothetical protein
MRDAVATLDSALANFPSDNFLLEEKRKITKIQETKKQVILDIMTNDHRVPSKEMTRICV